VCLRFVTALVTGRRREVSYDVIGDVTGEFWENKNCRLRFTRDWFVCKHWSCPRPLKYKEKKKKKKKEIIIIIIVIIIIIIINQLQ